MQYKATTVEEYIGELPEERKAAMTKLWNVVKKNIPKGFQAGVGYGHIGYSVPHSKYPNGYHCDPNQPLPFLGIASQKNFIAVYHMGIYANPTLLKWFTTEYKKRVPTRLDMGKSCIRFTKPENIPFDLIGELCTKVTPDEWISIYEKNLKAPRKSK